MPPPSSARTRRKPRLTHARARAEVGTAARRFGQPGWRRLSRSPTGGWFHSQDRFLSFARSCGCLATYSRATPPRPPRRKQAIPRSIASPTSTGTPAARNLYPPPAANDDDHIAPCLPSRSQDVKAGIAARPRRRPRGFVHKAMLSPVINWHGIWLLGPESRYGQDECILLPAVLLVGGCLLQ